MGQDKKRDIFHSIFRDCLYETRDEIKNGRGQFLSRLNEKHQAGQFSVIKPKQGYLNLHDNFISF